MSDTTLVASELHSAGSGVVSAAPSYLGDLGSLRKGDTEQTSASLLYVMLSVCFPQTEGLSKQRFSCTKPRA